MAQVSWAPVGGAIGVAVTERKGAPYVWQRLKLRLGGYDVVVSPSITSSASGSDYNAAVFHLMGDLHLGVLYLAHSREVRVYVLDAGAPAVVKLASGLTAGEVDAKLKRGAIEIYTRAVLGKTWRRP